MATIEPPTDEQVLAVYSRDIQAYGRLDLYPPEVVLLRRLRGRWSDVDMLDIGVGSGRTAHVFSAITKSYLGIDFSRDMLARARSVVPEERGLVEFAEADARDLRALGRTFDVVLFSGNGLDTLGPVDRARVLDEVRAVIRPGGRFAFSSHSLHALPLESPLTALRGRSLHVRAVKSLLALPDALRTRRFNDGIDPDALRAGGSAMLADGSTHRGDLTLHWVRADVQVQQLAAAGFEVLEVIDWAQRSVDPAAPGRDRSLFYVSAPAS